MSVDTHDDTRYRIRPLKWRRASDGRYRQGWVADTPFAIYQVFRWRDETTGKWESWRWDYHVSDRDEGQQECRTAADGKRLAWEHWRERLVDALDAVP